MTRKITVSQRKSQISSARLDPKWPGTTTAAVWEQLPQLEWKHDGFGWEDAVVST